jgi:hypothetical protein
MVDVAFKTVSESITVSATSGGASGNVLYTCPSNHDAIIEYLCATNGASSNQKITVEFYHLDDTTYHQLAKAHAVSGNDSYHLITSNRFYLHAGDKIVCSKDGGTFDVTISAREFFNPNRT